jgi:hypothetical protein
MVRQRSYKVGNDRSRAVNSTQLGILDKQRTGKLGNSAAVTTFLDWLRHQVTS